MGEKIKLSPDADLPGGGSASAKQEPKTPEKKEVSLTPEQQAVKKEMMEELAAGHISYALGIKERFSLPEEILSSPEIQQAVKKEMMEELAAGHIDYALRIKEKFPLPEEILSSPEIQQAAGQGMMLYLVSGQPRAALEIKEEFSLPEEILSSPEIQQIAKKEMIGSLLSGHPRAALEIKKKFFLPEEILSSPEIQQAAGQQMMDSLVSGQTAAALRIKEKFPLPEEILSSSEFQKAARERMMYCLDVGDIDYAFEIKEKFFLPEEIVQQAVRQQMMNRLAAGHINYALRIKEKFPLPEEIVQQAARQGMMKQLADGHIDCALGIKEKFSLPEEIVQQAARQGMMKQLADGQTAVALEIKNEFSLNITYAEIVKEFPDVKELIEKVDKISPGFGLQVEKSQDILFSLFQFQKNPEEFLKNLNENPFLINAVSENPRMGSKLLVKFPELDQLSKENIAALFEIKTEIMAQNPDIDPESFEFRQMMQERLKTHKNNPEILKAIEAGGINVEQWLNYDETRYFQLESGAGLSFSETVATPLGRIKETIDSYSNRIKEVLSQYRTELAGAKIPLENSAEIKEKIAKMQEEMAKAQAEHNDKKAQGIQKGIDGLTMRMSNIKSISLWDKVIGDIGAFQGLKNDVFSAQERLIETERQFSEKASGKTPSGKEIQDLKQKITKAKDELRAKFGLLERRIEDFQNNLPGFLSPTLGEDRTKALIQEIQTGLEEQFNHYSTDRSTLANLFSERTDREKEKMEGQPMSIFVWARNPDIDLYQANYSPCCISIESGCASNSSESAIADYNTDLGIQIVNIWDETKNEPVTAAWCWVGKDEKGNTALVVDNIESNPMYSVNYPEQLTKELFAFLEKYAQSVGAQKLVLGELYNDLPIKSEQDKMPDGSAEYDKIGGYNRNDGYYLEAEDEPVKIIWQREKTAEREKIKFGQLETIPLSQKDFAGLLKMEEKIYPENLILGQTLLEDIRKSNGLEYSIVAMGKRKNGKKAEKVGYLVAVDGKTPEGNPTVYLEDIAVLPEAQGQGIAWRMVKEIVKKLQAKAKRENKPVLWDMHLREASQGLLEKHKEDLEKMGIKIIEDALIPGYYDEGEDALYRVYEIKPA